MLHRNLFVWPEERIGKGSIMGLRGPGAALGGLTGGSGWRATYFYNNNEPESKRERGRAKE